MTTHDATRWPFADVMLAMGAIKALAMHAGETAFMTLTNGTEWDSEQLDNDALGEAILELLRDNEMDDEQRGHYVAALEHGVTVGIDVLTSVRAVLESNGLLMPNPDTVEIPDTLDEVKWSD